MSTRTGLLCGIAVSVNAFVALANIVGWAFILYQEFAHPPVSGYRIWQYGWSLLSPVGVTITTLVAPILAVVALIRVRFQQT